VIISCPLICGPADDLLFSNIVSDVLLIRYFLIKSTAKFCLEMLGLLYCRYILPSFLWSHHSKIVGAKAKRPLNFYCHSLWGATYHCCKICCIQISLVRPTLEFACQIWSPNTAHDISTLENVQHYTARGWAFGSRWDAATNRWNKSSSECVDMLHWSTLTVCRNYLHFQ